MGEQKIIVLIIHAVKSPILDPKSRDSYTLEDYTCKRILSDFFGHLECCLASTSPSLFQGMNLNLGLTSFKPSL